MRFKSILFITFVFLFSHTQASNDFSIKTVVIDAGHGGKDPGALGPGKAREKDIALSIALKLGEDISKNFPDVNVIYTRKTDVFLELHERAEIANKAKADLFIAIHINSSTNPDFYGTSCYVLGLHRTEANLEVAKRENSVILLEDDRDKNYEFDPNTPEGHIIMSMKQNAFLDQSISYASKIEDHLENSAKRKSMGVKQAGFYVLYKTAMPSILAEVGFISNPEEEKYLLSPKGQDQIANSLFNAFKEYKVEMEGSQTTKTTTVQKEDKPEVAKNEVRKEQEVKQQVEKTEPVPEKKQQQKEETSEQKKQETVEQQKVEPVIKKAAEKTEPPAKQILEPTKAKPTETATVSNSSTVRKPVEKASGGGKATANVEPLKQAEAEQAKEEEVKQVEAVPVREEVRKAEPKPEVKKEPVQQQAKAPSVATSVVFKVQLFAVKTEPKDMSSISKKYSPISTEPVPGSELVRYFTGNYKSYADAKSHLATIKTSGYPDAYIVGFKNGVRLTPAQLREFQ